LSITAWSGCPTFNFGSIDMGSKNYVTSGGSSDKSIDFTGSTVSYNATTHVITLTLGTEGGQGAQGTVPTSVATLTVDAGLLGANGIGVSPATFATGNVQQF
jgi:hypothetical protein